jgi:hypothetical protein
MWGDTMTTRRTSVIAATIALAVVGWGHPAIAFPPAARDQVFFFLQDSGAGEDGIRVFAAGPILGLGTAKAGTPAAPRLSRGAVPTDGAFTLTFGAGTVSYAFKQENETLLQPTAPACVEYATVKGTFTISGGTGAYAKATGSGAFGGYLLKLGAKGPDGNCAPGAARELQAIAAGGTAATE